MAIVSSWGGSGQASGEPMAKKSSATAQVTGPCCHASSYRGGRLAIYRTFEARGEIASDQFTSFGTGQRIVGGSDPSGCSATIDAGESISIIRLAAYCFQAVASPPKSFGADEPSDTMAR